MGFILLSFPISQSSLARYENDGPQEPRDLDEYSSLLRATVFQTSFLALLARSAFAVEDRKVFDSAEDCVNDKDTGCNDTIPICITDDTREPSSNIEGYVHVVYQRPTIPRGCG
jgi:hypothetical protein